MSGSRRGSEKRKMQKVLTMRLDDETYEALTTAAGEDTLAVFVRRLIEKELALEPYPVKRTRKRPAPEWSSETIVAANQLRIQVARCQGNVTQLTQAVRESRMFRDLHRQIEQVLAEMKRTVKGLSEIVEAER